MMNTAVYYPNINIDIDIDININIIININMLYYNNCSQIATLQFTQYHIETSPL